MIKPYTEPMYEASPNYAVLSCFADICKALGHTHRLLILEHLAQGEHSVEMLAERTRLSFANTSRHLQQLRHAGMVATRREGKRMIYSLSDDAIVTLISAVQTVAERQAGEMERITRTYFRARDTLEPVSQRELLKRMQQAEVTLLDVRPFDEYAQGHVPGARNIPLKELEKRLVELPSDREIIAYCRGPYCVLAYEAVALLRREGRNARRLQAGFPEWRIAGHPVETTS